MLRQNTEVRYRFTSLCPSHDFGRVLALMGYCLRCHTVDTNSGLAELGHALTSHAATIAGTTMVQKIPVPVSFFTSFRLPSASLPVRAPISPDAPSPKSPSPFISYICIAAAPPSSSPSRSTAMFHCLSRSFPPTPPPSPERAAHHRDRARQCTPRSRPQSSKPAPTTRPSQDYARSPIGLTRIRPRPLAAGAHRACVPAPATVMVRVWPPDVAGRAASDVRFGGASADICAILTRPMPWAPAG
ncbi:hypothetical protein C8R44DRAFT_893352 [Mycena epipterygia]|nr:hypothetical protein C8R44DRAFT_893352 [Mycena epipterygia]